MYVAFQLYMFHTLNVFTYIVTTVSPDAYYTNSSYMFSKVDNGDKKSICFQIAMESLEGGI